MCLGFLLIFACNVVSMSAYDAYINPSWLESRQIQFDLGYQEIQSNSNFSGHRWWWEEEKMPGLPPFNNKVKPAVCVQSRKTYLQKMHSMLMFSMCLYSFPSTVHKHAVHHVIGSLDLLPCTEKKTFGIKLPFRCFWNITYKDRKIIPGLKHNLYKI